MRPIGVCAACGQPAAAYLDLRGYGQVCHRWLLCDAHLACLAAEAVSVSFHCMDQMVRLVSAGLWAQGAS